MGKLKVSDLDKIKEKVKRTIALRDGSGAVRVIVHMGTCGIAAGARDIMKALMDEVGTQDIADVDVTTSGCAGLCSKEPMATVEKSGEPPVKYVELTGDKMKKIVQQHVVGGNIVQDYALAIGSEQTY